MRDARSPSRQSPQSLSTSIQSMALALVRIVGPVIASDSRDMPRPGADSSLPESNVGFWHHLTALLIFQRRHFLPSSKFLSSVAYLFRRLRRDKPLRCDSFTPRQPENNPMRKSISPFTDYNFKKNRESGVHQQRFGWQIGRSADRQIEFASLFFSGRKSPESPEFGCAL